LRECELVVVLRAPWYCQSLQPQCSIENRHDLIFQPIFATSMVSKGQLEQCSGPPTGPGGRPPGLFVTHAQWVGGRPFRFSARAGRVGVVLKYIPGRAGGRSIFRPGARGRRPVFDLFLPRDKVAFLKLRLTFFSSLNIRSHLSA